MDRKQARIYALDFDGVICDSAVETAVAGWKAGQQLWDDYTTALPTPDLIEQFRQIRPAMETGYEAILIIRLLHKKHTVESILENYSDKLKEIINQSSLDIDALKKIFGETRDQWINNDLNDWVAMNPLFSGVTKKLQNLGKQNIWYIITTKQERFVKHILTANHIQLSDSRIFGLDRKKSKETILVELISKHPDMEIAFIEDRLPTLFNVINNRKLSTVKLFFALWGYNTQQDKSQAEKESIESIQIDAFLVDVE